MIRFMTSKAAISHMLADIRKSNHSLAMLKNFRVVTRDRSFVVSKLSYLQGEDGLQFYLRNAKEKQNEVSKNNLRNSGKDHARGVFSERD